VHGFLVQGLVGVVLGVFSLVGGGGGWRGVEARRAIDAGLRFKSTDPVSIINSAPTLSKSLLPIFGAPDAKTATQLRRCCFAAPPRAAALLNGRRVSIIAVTAGVWDAVVLRANGVAFRSLLGCETKASDLSGDGCFCRWMAVA